MKIVFTKYAWPEITVKTLQTDGTVRVPKRGEWVVLDGVRYAVENITTEFLVGESVVLDGVRYAVEDIKTEFLVGVCDHEDQIVTVEIKEIR